MQISVVKGQGDDVYYRVGGYVCMVRNQGLSDEDAEDERAHVFQAVDWGPWDRGLFD